MLLDILCMYVSLNLSVLLARLLYLKYVEKGDKYKDLKEHWERVAEGFGSRWEASLCTTLVASVATLPICVGKLIKGE